MNDLLTMQERATIQRVRDEIERVERLDWRGPKPATTIHAKFVFDLLDILRDAEQRHRIAVRDERWRWQNRIVEILEQYEKETSVGFETPESVFRWLYEKLNEQPPD